MVCYVSLRVNAHPLLLVANGKLIAEQPAISGGLDPWHYMCRSWRRNQAHYAMTRRFMIG